MTEWKERHVAWGKISFGALLVALLAPLLGSPSPAAAMLWVIGGAREACLDKVEAKTVLAEVIARYRDRDYGALARLLGNPEIFEAPGHSGKLYQIEAEALWDDKAEDNLRLIVSIDDGGLLSSFSPMSDDFVMAPDGSFVGE